jgi:hypothetical protein
MRISFSTVPRKLSDDGDGDRTTLGIRVCFPFVVVGRA